MNRLRRVLASSLGKKALMAGTGLLLVSFLVVHLAGNLLLYAGEDGRKFDGYARSLDGNPLLPLAEVALLALFVSHIALAIRVSLENREARPERYAVRASSGGRTIASASMLVTGLIVLAFLVVHLADFRVAKSLAEEPASLAAMVRRRLSSAPGAAIYLVGVAAVGVHLRHAFASALQTLGIHHPRLNPLVARVGWIVAIALALGFASFPVYFLWTGGAR